MRFDFIDIALEILDFWLTGDNRNVKNSTSQQRKCLLEKDFLSVAEKMVETKKVSVKN